MTGGDLDHDVQEEIILWVGGSGNYNEQRKYVVAFDGSINSGWPYTYRADYDPDHYDFAIADMDRDGTVEIIYTQANEIGILKLDE